MKLIRALLLSLALVNPALAADYVAGTPSAGQSPGTTTNDNAVAGNVGEYISSSCTTQTATVTFTGTTTNLVVWTNTIQATFPCPVSFTTTGSLPSGISASTTYYTIPSTLTASNFKIASTIANAIAGTAITLTSNGTATTTGLAAGVTSTGVVQSVTGLTLTAGDWDVSCLGSQVPLSTATSTMMLVGISASETVLGALGTYTQLELAFPSGDNTENFSTPPVRESLSATTTIFCDVDNSSATANFNTNAVMRARRVR